MNCCGVDGCQQGWVIASREKGVVSFQVLPEFPSVLNLPFDIIAVDIPIGLPKKGPRSADRLARQTLGPRAPSVFSAPLRGMLVALDWEDACRIRLEIEGKKITKQAWGIMKKIREVDSALDPAVRTRVYEVHPELCFWRMAGNPMAFPKKKLQGRLERLSHLSPFGVSEGFVLEQRRLLKCKADDLIDALAALWTAEEIAAARAQAFPLSDEIDEKGLAMRIWA